MSDARSKIEAALDGVESFLDEIHEVTGGNFTDRYEWSRRAAESIEKLAAARIDYAALPEALKRIGELTNYTSDDELCNLRGRLSAIAAQVKEVQI